jgi:hypothetical protein
MRCGSLDSGNSSLSSPGKIKITPMSNACTLYGEPTLWLLTLHLISRSLCFALSAVRLN